MRFLLHWIKLKGHSNNKSGPDNINPMEQNRDWRLRGRPPVAFTL